MTAPFLERGSLKAWRAALFEPAERLRAAMDGWAALHPIDEPFADTELTPAISCCLADLPDALERALFLGASPNRLDSSGWSPLHWCAQSSRPECAKILLAFGADPDSPSDLESCSPLHLSATSGCLATAELLSLAGAKLDSAEPGTRASAAHWACHDPRWHEATRCEAPGPDGFGRGCLHWAVRQAADEEQALMACRHWLGLGERAELPDLEGSTPARDARLRGFDHCARMLAASAERSCLRLEAALGVHAVAGAEPLRL